MHSDISLFFSKITCSLKGTLRDLKIAISKSTALGMIPVDHQRIFHLGRELKTPGRTLEALGVGRFHGLNKIVIHVHANPSVAASSATINTVDRQPRRPPKLTARKYRSIPQEPEVVNLDSDDDDDDDIIAIDVDNSTTTHQKKRRRQI